MLQFNLNKMAQAKKESALSKVPKKGTLKKAKFINTKKTNKKIKSPNTPSKEHGLKSKNKSSTSKPKLVVPRSGSKLTKFEAVTSKNGKKEKLYTIEKITGLRGNVGDSRAELRFKVYWTGFKEPTWEPCQSIKNLGVFREYVRQHSKEWVRNLFDAGQSSKAGSKNATLNTIKSFPEKKNARKQSKFLLSGEALKLHNKVNDNIIYTHKFSKFSFYIKKLHTFNAMTPFDKDDTRNKTWEGNSNSEGSVADAMLEGFEYYFSKLFH